MRLRPTAKIFLRRALRHDFTFHFNSIVQGFNSSNPSFGPVLWARHDVEGPNTWASQRKPMNKPKYIRKEMIQINENLRVYKYFYTWGVSIYFSPKNEAEEVVKIDVAYGELANFSNAELNTKKTG